MPEVTATATGIRGFLRTIMAGKSGVSGGIWTLVDQGLVSAGNFLTGVIIGRFCTKDDFGLYMLGLTFMYIGQNVQMSLINTPYAVYCPRCSGRELSEYTGSMTTLQVILCVVMIAVTMATSAVIAGINGPAGLPSILFALGLGLEFLMFREFVRQLNFSRMRFLETLKLDVIVLFVQFPVFGLLLTLDLFSARNAFLAMSLACAVAAVHWLYAAREQLTFVPSRLVADAKSTWKLGRWPLYASLTMLLGIQIYPWLLTSFKGTGSTGNLAAVMGITNLVNPFLIGAGNFLGPKILHRYAEGGRAAMGGFVTKSTIALGLVMGGYCLCMLFFGGALVRLVYGQEYAQLGAVVGIVSLSQAADVVTFPSRAGLLALERPDLTFKIGLGVLCFSLTIGASVVFFSGLLGVGIGLLAGNLLACGVRLLAYQRVLRQTDDARQAS